MINPAGVDFSVARRRLIETLHEEVGRHEDALRSLEKGDHGKGLLVPMGKFSLPSVFVVVLLCFAIAFTEYRLDFVVGLACSIGIILLVLAVTYFVCLRYLKNARYEVIDEIKSMVCGYLDILESASPACLPSRPVIHTGDPHVSIVTAYRNMEWQRLPSLLLVEGDIISLMAGDITPGKVQELVPLEHSGGNTGHHCHNKWRRVSEKVIEKGEKIRTKKRRKPRGNGILEENNGSRYRHDRHSSYHSGGGPGRASEKQRTIASNSVELLHFSGDTRCFVLIETPLVEFCRNIFRSDYAAANLDDMNWDLSVRDVQGLFRLGSDPNPQGLKSDKLLKNSLLRSLMKVLLSESKLFFWGAAGLLAVGAIIRLILLPETRGHWGQIIVVPFATIIIALSPVSLPLGYIAGEVLTTANLLTSVETSLKSQLSCKPGRDGAEDLSNADGASTQSAEEGRFHGSAAEDEFLERDIDDRAEKTAQKASTQIYWSRLFRYIYYVFKSRLSALDRQYTDERYSQHFVSSYDDEVPPGSVSSVPGCMCGAASGGGEERGRTEVRRHRHRFGVFNWSYKSADAQLTFQKDTAKTYRQNHSMLPVPFVRNRLVEVLGAITRVCFVDDDVICEGFSVTEEIFLLNSAETAKGVGARSTVLDLHSNAQAVGGRFEDPEWVKYLSSLKPLGLGALLTLSPSAPTPNLGSTGASSWNRRMTQLAPQAHLSSKNRFFLGPIDRFRRTRELHSTQLFYPIRHDLVSQSGPVSTGYSFRDAFQTYNFSRNGRLALESSNTSLGSVDAYASVGDMPSSNLEKDLIVHVRKTLPFEVLRNLGEEIGFSPDDVSSFSRLVEMNVLAPRLAKVRVMEDTHRWGQEETRRRGTLVSHGRAVVVEDARGGGQQLMSHGDPALILSYCREYWDGAHITHLSSADRKEVLSVYERWILEDFDVVSFAYTPVPAFLEPWTAKARRDQEEINRRILNNTISNDDSESSGSLLSITPFCSASDMDDNMRAFDIPALSERALNFRDVPQLDCLFFIDPSTELDLHLSAVARRRTASGATAEVIARKARMHRAATAMRRDLSGQTASPTASRRHDHHKHHHHHRQSKTDSKHDRHGKRSNIVDAMNSQVSQDVGVGSVEDGNNLFGNNGLSLSGVVEHLIGEDPDGQEINARYRQRSHSDAAPSELLRQRNAIDFSSGATFGELELGAVKFDHEGTPENQSISSASIIAIPRAYSDSNIRFGLHTNNSVGAKNIAESIFDIPNDQQPKIISMILSNSDAPASFDRSSEQAVMTASETRLGAEAFEEVMDPEIPVDSAATAGNGKEFSVGEGVQLDEISLSTNPVVDERDENSYVMVESTKEVLNSSAGDLASLGETAGLVQFTPVGVSYTDPSSHLMLKRSVSLDFASMALAAAEVDARFRQLNIAPLQEIERSDGIEHPDRDNLAVKVHEALSPPEKQPSYSRGMTVDQRSLHLPDKMISKRSKNNLGAALWPLMHQQVFLGMSASSVPVRPEAPELMEDCQAAGIRFVFFSARNMRRSKRIAEKIGLQTDWNCAISLRDLEDGEHHDPNRFEWDIKARLPHGVAAIKEHLKYVDNVPLLVSLFSDSTPETIQDMIDIFRENGEVVMTIGSAYRALNQEIFNGSDVAISVVTMPGRRTIPLRAKDLVDVFPKYSVGSLCRADMSLVFGLISLGTAALLQVPNALHPSHSHGSYANALSGRPQAHSDNTRQSAHFGAKVDLGSDPLLRHIEQQQCSGEVEGVAPQLRLPALLESVRKCRVFLLNIYQILGASCVCLCSLASWPVVAQALPISVPPVLPPPLALLFVLLYIPALMLSMLFTKSIENVMKNTPRKSNLTVRARDKARFLRHLLLRVVFAAISVGAVGWLAIASMNEVEFGSSVHMPAVEWSRRMGRFYEVLDHANDGVVGSGSRGSFSSEGLERYYHIQDVMSCEMLLVVLFQVAWLMSRGQSLWELPSPTSHPMFFASALGVCLIHAAVMVARVWVALIVLPVVAGSVLALALNGVDRTAYRRHITMLRLEFDTKLGMHSPK